MRSIILDIAASLSQLTSCCLVAVMTPSMSIETICQPCLTRSKAETVEVVRVRVKMAVVFITKSFLGWCFPPCVLEERTDSLIKPFSTGKSAVLREPAEPSISNASRDAANLTPVNSGFPTPTKLFFALGAFCAGCCSRQPVYKRLLPEAHHEEVAACASFGLLTGRCPADCVCQSNMEI